MKNPEDEELKKILDELDIRGEITNSNHPLVCYIKKNQAKMKKSKIKDSYIKNVEWKEYKKDNSEIYLFRIVKRINPNIKNLIINEYSIHKSDKELDNFSPKFICYFFSNFLNFSVFNITEYYTLEEIIEKKVSIYLSKKELLLSLSESINILKSNENFIYICPFLTPSNLLYTEESGKDFFYFTEIFLVSDSTEKELEIELNIASEWLIPEFKMQKAKISFNSNICCLGYLFYIILYNEKPFKNEKERKENNNMPILKEDFQHKELIEKCIKSNPTERCSIDEIQDYINNKIYEDSNTNNNTGVEISINNLDNENIHINNNYEDKNSEQNFFDNSQENNDNSKLDTDIYDNNKLENEGIHIKEKNIITKNEKKK